MSEDNSEDKPDEETPKQKVPDLSTDDLRKFVADYRANQVFIFQHIKEGAKTLVGSIFMPLGLGGASHIDFNDVGTIYAYYKDAGPRAINGYPIFFSCAFMNCADWDKARAAIIDLEEIEEKTLEKLVPSGK